MAASSEEYSQQGKYIKTGQPQLKNSTVREYANRTRKNAPGVSYQPASNIPNFDYMSYCNYTCKK